MPDAGPPRGVPGRDRDAAGRARSARPRDVTGRPLPYGAEGIPPIPADGTGEDGPGEGVPDPAGALAEAERLLVAGRPFAAHEVLEAAWKAAPRAESPLWRGLAQVAVGLTHLQRGNARGAVALLRRGAANIAPFADGHSAGAHSAEVPSAGVHSAEASPYGVPVRALVTWAEALAAAVEDAGSAAAAAAPPRPALG